MLGPVMTWTLYQCVVATIPSGAQSKIRKGTGRGNILGNLNHLGCGISVRRTWEEAERERGK